MLVSGKPEIAAINLDIVASGIKTFRGCSNYRDAILWTNDQNSFHMGSLECELACCLSSILEIKMNLKGRIHLICSRIFQNVVESDHRQVER